MRSFMMMIVALILMIVAAIPVALLQVVRYMVTRRKLGDLFFAIAIGLDQLGGSILYVQPDWTVSSRTYWLRVQGNTLAGIFERFINLFFGRNHCELSYLNEFGDD